MQLPHDIKKLFAAAGAKGGASKSKAKRRASAANLKAAVSKLTPAQRIARARKAAAARERNKHKPKDQ